MSGFIGGVISGLPHSHSHAAPTKPNYSYDAPGATPQIPRGKSNFNPVLAPGSSYDVQLIEDQATANQSETTDLEYTDGYYGYARPTTADGPQTVRMLAGARVIIDGNGSVTVDNLYGRAKEVTYPESRLEEGPVTIDLGGGKNGYELELGMDPNAEPSMPMLYYGPKSQGPDPNTFTNQP